MLAGVALALATGAAPPTVAEPAIDQRIEAQRKQIESTEQERAAARAALANLQERMAFLKAKADEIDAERGKLQARRRALDQREAELRDGLAERRDALARRLQAAYPLTRGSVLQAVLGDGDILQTDRDLHYLRALIRPVQAAHRALERQRVELAENRREIARTTRKLRETGRRLDHHYDEVGRNLDEQQRLLASLGETLDRQQQELKDLLDRKRRLDREVAAAREAAEKAAQRATADQPRADREQGERPNDIAPVAETPGRIRDDGRIPIAGRIEHAFGETLPPGRLRNDGVIFRVDEASAVRAIAAGQVAFAGTLKGWGQLVMLRHEGDYLSLYAHCRSLDVARGDRVERGDRLCTSGVIDAGQEGLYVEVRQGNRPIDPDRWPAWRRAVSS